MNNIAPLTWREMGGQGTIDYYPLGMSLVITQTPDIQEQVADLLSALRRLEDQQVAIEIRFITIAENFYERIGVDFNINIRNDQSKYESQIVSQQFRPFGFINHFTPNSFLTGLTPAGSFTQDLNIPVRTSSYEMAVPPFGAYPNIPGGNGGVSMGIAFLSDIEVYMFMEAAQGDQRTNVMQAPKLTLYNGQTSTITISDTQFFVTSVTVAQLGGQVVFVPNNSPFPTGGVTLAMNAVISADRRFVRMSLNPILTNLTTANVQLYPITTFITPIFEGGAVGQPVPFTQFLQQPAFNTISVMTTVNVPDGGTVLLGGLKRLSEGRNEFGPPILSKIPYINRLFKNVGYGRETESLLMMVTPRIIINEEEEQRQVLGTAGPGAAAP
jgi:type II secretory pathway component GspD/PulD (secretin)